KKNVIDKILANKSMRNEMGLLLPHEQLSRIIGEITASRTITKDQAAQLAKLRDGVMLNLKNPEVFDNLVRQSKVYSQEEYNRKVRAYHEVFDNLSNVVRNLNNSNIINDADLKALRPITELLSERFDNPEDLKRSVDAALTNFKVSTTIGENLADGALVIGKIAAIVFVVAAIIFLAIIAADGKIFNGPGGSSSSFSDYYWYRLGRSSRTSNYHTNDYSRNTNSSTPARQNTQSENRQEQTNMQRKKIFGLKANQFNSLSRQV
ncbi:MAG: hypothetical protein NTU89_02780, partial [Candidatus Dependentiae bacterium]|nr:hypothetical protein [Candidatus Dependentiae bacterium]